MSLNEEQTADLYASHIPPCHQPLNPPSQTSCPRPTLLPPTSSHDSRHKAVLAYLKESKFTDSFEALKVRACVKACVRVGVTPPGSASMMTNNKVFHRT